MKTFCNTLFLFSCFSLSLNAFGQQYRTGLNMDNNGPKGLAIYKSDAFGFSGDLPDSTSLRKYAPYPGNQGNYGTCVGWSWGYCALTTLYARQFGIENRNVITAMAMCPYAVFNNIRGATDITCQDGARLEEAGKFLTTKGSKRFHLRDSDCGTTDEQDEDLMIFKADSYTLLWDWAEEEENDKVAKAKSALADGNIVLIGMGVGTSFSRGVNDQGEWIKSSYPSENKPTGGHALCVLGYNDKRFGGTFEIQNSWGQDWGDGGYVYVTYADFQEYVRRACVMELDDQNKWTDAATKKGCLFGDCNGTYSRFTFENGDSYEGMTKNGMPEGNGIYQWKDGDVYTGEFKAGLKEGRGSYFFADGSTQKGHWKADEYREDLAYLDYTYGMVDLGEYYWEGYANNKKWMYGSYYLSSGEKIYDGKFSEKGNPNDFGLLLKEDKNVLSEFEEGSYQGYSTVFSEGSWSIYTCLSDECEKVEEAFVSKTIENFPEIPETLADTMINNSVKCDFGDCENGFARFTYPSGNSYTGFLVNGWRHGYGTYLFKEDSKIVSFEGEYRNGLRNGMGRLKMKGGAWFIGEFVDGQADGQGMWLKADGTIQAGYWEKGKYIVEDNGFGFAKGEEVTMDGKVKKGVSPAKEKTPRKFAAPIQFK